MALLRQQVRMGSLLHGVHASRSMKIGSKEAHMVGNALGRLLEDAVNSSCKLAIVMLFAEDAGLVADEHQLSRRLCRDIWSVEQALSELVSDAVLINLDGSYRFQPDVKYAEGLRQLLQVYDEPEGRQEIVRIVSDLDRYAPYREMLRRQRVEIVSA
jgi:hypothetical protein